jgi:hypothetical protein
MRTIAPHVTEVARTNGALSLTFADGSIVCCSTS